MAISFYFQVKKFSLTKKKITDWILLVAYLEHREIGDINYVFCTDEFLRHLNKKFFHHTTYTDIITFDYTSKKELNVEIYISVERVKENAKIFKSSFNQELMRVIIHGVLHTMGYDDKSPKEKKRMRTREDECLQLFYEMK